MHSAYARTGNGPSCHTPWVGLGSVAAREVTAPPPRIAVETGPVAAPAVVPPDGGGTAGQGTAAADAVGELGRQGRGGGHRRGPVAACAIAGRRPNPR